MKSPKVNTPKNTSKSARTESKRSISSHDRISNTFQTTRTALAVEASSLRYAQYFMTPSEESIARGWDLDEDEDGT